MDRDMENRFEGSGTSVSQINVETRSAFHWVSFAKRTSDITDCLPG